MIARKLLISGFSSVLLIFSGAAFALDQERDQDRTQTQDQKQVYGSQLMTDQERVEHRLKMRSSKSPEERAKYRKEHHERMKVRAKEKGVTLPDEPPEFGGGMGPGGGGMGPGAGKNR